MNSTLAPPDLKRLTPAQLDFYHTHGYLILPGIYDRQEVEAMRKGLQHIIDHWAVVGTGWKSKTGQYDNSAETEVIVVQKLEYYSDAWERMKHKAAMVEAAIDLLGPNVEYFGSSTHSKPARSGGAFPMHQDSLFYDHQDERLLICMVHLDDTDASNGPISFVPEFQKSHIPHTVETDPEQGGPYLDPDQYGIDDATPAICKAGDVVIFNQYTIHGSKPNTTDRARRAVVFRYRHPDNLPTHKGGHRPMERDDYQLGVMVAGGRPPREGYCAPPGGNTSRPAPREWFIKKK